MPAALAAALLLLASVAHAQGGTKTTLVFCAPGFPGSTAEAQPELDALTAALVRRTGGPASSLGAVYVPTEKEGLARLAQPDAAVALVPLPFLVKHGSKLQLHPRLQAVMQGAKDPNEVWTLVAAKGRVPSADALAGFTLASTAGYAPTFVRGALAGWGRLPDSVTIVESAQVLSYLRKAAAGEKVALLLDSAQAASLASLPFANQLEVVARSAPLPTGFVATVRRRLPQARWKSLEAALLQLPEDPQGAAALRGIRMERFVPAEAAALTTVKQLQEAGR